MSLLYKLLNKNKIRGIKRLNLFKNNKINNIVIFVEVLNKKVLKNEKLRLKLFKKVNFDETKSLVRNRVFFNRKHLKYRCILCRFERFTKKKRRLKLRFFFLENFFADLNRSLYTLKKVNNRSEIENK